MRKGTARYILSGKLDRYEQGMKRVELDIRFEVEKW